VKTCASEQNTKLALVFYRERSQVSSTRSVIKAENKKNKKKTIHYGNIFGTRTAAHSGIEPAGAYS
jgi:hypothetical protein